MIEKPFNQISVNHYEPGRGIGQHIDTIEGFEGPVASISLLSDIVINFRKGEEELALLLPARCFLLIDGPSRYEWTHGISYKRHGRKSDFIDGIEVVRQERIAVTYRRVIP